MIGRWVSHGVGHGAGAEVVLRLAGAALLGDTARIHLELWHQGYRAIATIGPLFLANGVLAILGALSVLAAPRVLLPWAAAGGALLAAGTFAGLQLSLHGGLFGFTESSRAPLLGESEVVELAAAAVLAALAALARTAPRRVQSSGR